jgi:magnesium chelatase family protein
MDPKHTCRCTDFQILKYRNRISGPLMDRIDIHVEVPAVPRREMRKGTDGESSAWIRKRVSGARNIQRQRFMQTRIPCNARMGGRQVKRHCPLDSASTRLLESAMDRLGLSARAYNRILKISRTIADLSQSEAIAPDHVAEAIQYRSLDRGKEAF